MSNTTTTTHAAQREAGIAAYTAALAELEKARATGDHAAKLKAAGKLGTPVERIREAELEMALAGESFEPWVKPKTARPSKLVPIGTAAEVQAEIDALRKVQKTAPESVVKSANQRIDALKRAAAKRGLKVS